MSIEEELIQATHGGPRASNPLPAGPILPLHEIELRAVAPMQLAAYCRRCSKQIWSCQGDVSADALIAAIRDHARTQHQTPGRR